MKQLKRNFRLYGTLGGLSLVMLMFFLNCGPGSFNTTEAPSSFELASMQALSSNFEFIFEPKAQKSIFTDSLKRVEAVESIGRLTASLHPPFSGTSTRLNFEAAPVYEDQSLKFSPFHNLELSRYQINRTYSGEYILAITLSDLSFESEANNVIRVLDLYPPESTDYNGHIFLQFVRYQAEGVTKYRFESGVWYTENQFFIRHFELDDPQIDQKFLLMLVVPSEATSFRMIVNGIEHESPARGETHLRGTPPSMPRNVRSLSLNGYSKGFFNLHSIHLGLTALGVSQANQTYQVIAQREGLRFNGSTLTSQPGTGGPGSVTQTITYNELMGIGSRAVFANSCVSCHSAASPLGGLNLQDFNQASSRISSIIARMEGQGRAIMPPTGRLPQAQIDIIKQWQAAGTPR